MLTNTLIISLGSSILLILLVLGLRRSILKQPEGGKRIIDSVKIVGDEVKKSVGKQNMVLFPVITAVFVLILYLVNWQTAFAFFAGALATVLINLILPHIVAQNSGRALDATRKSLMDGVNIALKSGVVSASLVLGLSLFITAGIYAIFQNTQILVGLGFGVALSSFYLKLSSNPKNLKIDPNASIHFFELTILATIIVMVSAKAVFGYPANSTFFALIIASASAITFAITSFFLRFFKSAKKFSTTLYSSIGFQAILLAGSIFFLKIWVLKGIGIHFLLNFYGLSLVALIILFLSGMAIVLNINNQIVENATEIAEKTEITEETRKRLSNMSLFDKYLPIITKYYLVKATALISILFFIAYDKSIADNILDLGNYRVLIGLFVGLILVSLFFWQKKKFEFESVLRKVIVIGTFILVPVLIGIFLGPVALGGYLIAVILSGLFAAVFLSQSFNNILLLTSVIVLLIASSII